jgi:hypothetical protein
MAPFLILGRKLGHALRLPGFGLTVQNDTCPKSVPAHSAAWMSTEPTPSRTNAGST